MQNIVRTYGQLDIGVGKKCVEYINIEKKVWISITPNVANAFFVGFSENFGS